MEFRSSFSHLLVLLLFIPSQAIQPTPLVQNICSQTSDYAFCVSTLTSDPRASSPDADRTIMALISFSQALIKAALTFSQIANLLENAEGDLKQGLQLCFDEYKTALLAIKEAFKDLQSETYAGLQGLVGIASDSAAKCEGAFNGTSPLTESNRDLRGKCEICDIIANLFK